MGRADAIQGPCEGAEPGAPWRRPGLRAALAGLPRSVPPGRPHDPGRFAPGSVARRVNAETRLLLAGPRALLLQLAHPLVAAAVADHSDVLRDPFGRLWRTLDLTLTVGFADAPRAAQAAVRVARTHATVSGSRGTTPYRATDPELLTWVHITLVDSALVGYERFVGRIGPRARDAYVREMNAQAAAFGVPPDRLWDDHASFRLERDRVCSRLRVTGEARALAGAVLRPPGSLAIAPVSGLLAFVTAGLLPPSIRDAYGLGWSPRRARALDALAAAIRAVGPVVPDPWRRWPHAREADARWRGGGSHERRPPS